MTVQRSLQVVSSNVVDDASGESDLLLAAFASKDMEQVNEHFGTASRFVIYRITESTATLERVCEFDQTNRDGNDDKLGPRLNALVGCHAVYCRAVGSSAVRLLLKQGIVPTQLERDKSIHSLIQGIQKKWIEEPSPYLTSRVGIRTRRVGATAFKRLLLEDDWQE